MGQKTKIGLALILGLAAAAYWNFREPTEFRSDLLQMSGKIPKGWSLWTNDDARVELAARDQVERRAPLVTMTPVRSPITAESVKTRRAEESRSLATPGDTLGPVTQTTVMGLNAWSFEANRLVAPAFVDGPGLKMGKAVRLRTITYYLPAPRVGVKIELGAPEVLFDKHKADFDSILASLKRLP